VCSSLYCTRAPQYSERYTGSVCVSPPLEAGATRCCVCFLLIEAREQDEERFHGGGRGHRELKVRRVDKYASRSMWAK
jgi:hypothetical protein